MTGKPSALVEQYGICQEVPSQLGTHLLPPSENLCVFEQIIQFGEKSVC